MKTELILKFSFEASHSLADYEVPHPHIWRLELAVSGEPIDGRIIDIVKLRSRVQLLVDTLSSTYLNSNPNVDDQVRLFPTCETLSEFFKQGLLRILEVEFIPANSSIRLASVMVALCEMDGTEMGAVRRSLL